MTQKKRKQKRAAIPEDVLGKAPPSTAIIGPGWAVMGFGVWLLGILGGSFAMTTGAMPERGMFIVLGWPALVGIPMVLVEAKVQERITQKKLARRAREDAQKVAAEARSKAAAEAAEAEAAQAETAASETVEQAQ